ncbi:hypothetical protein [Xanthomonas albilineans]|uniref:Uncharacterized protein n=1 Tax=Xanthomonas albilineans (strain GPE PC73 / CFBP 7063) TaxID=380358 RepID=D2UC09_XANAP|nr:hypothetical protein [Xanthomonas albilineans]CBA15197.1 hypothetical protein XALC_0679 [Xanthomonas albilineans GPE PC73]
MIMIERRCNRGSGWWQLTAGAALVVAVTPQGWGGGDGGAPVSAAPAAVLASVTPSNINIVASDADVRQKVYFAGPTQGFVAKALSASLPAGTESNYDILVIGDADKGGRAMLELARKALDEGKEVVLDAASDGSAQSAHANTLQALVGTSIDAGAVRVKKGGRGHYVTPIDTPAVVHKKMQIAAANAQSQESGSEPSINSVQNIFGIQSKESGQ